MAKKGSSTIALMAEADAHPTVLFYDRRKKQGLSTVPLETPSLLPRIGELVQLPPDLGEEEPPHDYCVVDIRYIYRKALDAEPLECVQPRYVQTGGMQSGNVRPGNLQPGKKPPRSAGAGEATAMHLLCVRIELDPMT